MRETQVQLLDSEYPLEEEMATHSSILAWEIPWTEEPGRLQPWGHRESDTNEQLTLAISHPQLPIKCESLEKKVCWISANCC